MGMRTWGAAVVAVLLLAGVVRAETGYEPLADWNSLPTLRPGTAHMASSYHRGGNTLSDFGNYDGGSTDGYFLVRDVAGGPGMITRFWMPEIAANGPASLRITVDGNAFTMTSAQFFNGTFGTDPAFSTPFTTTRLGGRVSYEPITFQSSVRIESTHAPGNQANFYQWEYRKLPAGSSVPSFNGTLTAAQLADRSKAAAVLNNAGVNPVQSANGAPEAGLTSQTQTSLSVPANGVVTIGSVSGPGQIQSLVLKMRGASASTTPANSVLDGLRVRIRYDNAGEPAVDVPVSYFFGVGHGRGDYKSVPVGVRDDGAYYSHWPMPFRSGAVVELVNSTGSAIAVEDATVVHKSGPVAANALYFHARHVANRALTNADPRYEVLNITGSGHYVGNFLFVDGVNGVLESNDIITVDGTTELRGTGLEDAYNGGYYYSDGASLDKEALYGLLRFGSVASTDQYRWRLTDAVPFTTGLNVSMENFRFNSSDPTPSVWGSTAFFYSSAVPEPGVLGSLGLAGISLLTRRRRDDSPKACE